MKEGKDMIGNTVIYPYLPPDASDIDCVAAARIAVLDAPMMAGSVLYGTIRASVTVDITSPERWAMLNEAMQRAFEIQRKIQATEAEKEHA